MADKWFAIMIIGIAFAGALSSMFNGCSLDSESSKQARIQAQVKIEEEKTKQLQIQLEMERAKENK